MSPLPGLFFDRNRLKIPSSPVRPRSDESNANPSCEPSDASRRRSVARCDADQACRANIAGCPKLGGGAPLHPVGDQEDCCSQMIKPRVCDTVLRARARAGSLSRGATIRTLFTCVHSPRVYPIRMIRR